MDDLVRWLGEQLDEDERRAWAAMNVVGPVLGAGEWRYAESLSDEGGQYWAVTTTPPNDTSPVVELVGSGMSGGGVHEEALAAHITAWDPARVLREIHAKRDLLRFAGGIHDHHDTFTTGVYARLEKTLRLFALAYADRAGYREEWRP